MLNDSSVLLSSARKEPRYILEGHDGNVKGIAEPNKASPLYRCIDVEATCEDLGLVSDEGNGTALHVAEACYYVLCVVRHNLIKGMSVRNSLDH